MTVCSHKNIPTYSLSQSIERILRSDLEIPRRNPLESPYVSSDELRDGIFKRPLIYTVFDGDQELMCGLMRHAIMKKGMVPVNPPSVVGYRDTVIRNKIKSKVLLEDVALLHKCDQIWIFADLEHAMRTGTPIPEGALFELLFAKLFRPDIEVFTVSIDTLFSGDLTPVPFNLEDIDKLSDPRSIEELTSHVRAVCDRIPKIRYYYYDPLDFKYGEWLRAFSEAPAISPLDPMLAIRLHDGQQPLGVVGECWLALLRLADEVCHVTSLHEQEGGSLWRRLVEAACRDLFELPSREISWLDLDVPKALLGSKWPVTTREADIVLSRKKQMRLCA